MRTQSQPRLVEERATSSSLLLMSFCSNHELVFSTTPLPQMLTYRLMLLATYLLVQSTVSTRYTSIPSVLPQVTTTSTTLLVTRVCSMMLVSSVAPTFPSRWFVPLERTPSTRSFKTRYGMVANPFAEGTTAALQCCKYNTNRYYRRAIVKNLM